MSHRIVWCLLAAHIAAGVAFQLCAATSAKTRRGPQRASSRCSSSAPDEAKGEELSSAWSSITRGTLYEKMVIKGPGALLLFYKDDMKEEFNKVANADSFIAAAEMSTLMSNIGAEITDGLEVIGTIERVQGVQRRDAEGNALVFFEQWCKYMNDYVNQKRSVPIPSGGKSFKWPWE
jgi:hypothetical protein